MKHFLRDIFIFFVSITGVAWVYRKLLRRRGPLVRIVVFHDVPNKKWFEETIQTLTKHFHVISPNDFSNKKFNTQKINVLLTFDDGYDSWVNVALPVLQAHNLKALFFVNSGLLDVAGDKEKEQQFLKKNLLLKYRAPLSWDGARKLVTEGQVVGGHSRSHERLSKLTKEDMQVSVQKDKQSLEQNLSIRLNDFAYPFGRETDINETVTTVVKEMGYSRGYSAEPGFVIFKDNYRIPRICIESNMTKLQLKQWIKGGYDLFASTKTRHKHV